MLLTLPHTLAGRYRLARLLGSGSCADTYLATDLETAQPVAVKVLRSPLAGDHDAAVRFAREVSAAAAIDHPHVVQVLDAGQEGDTRFIVMEAVIGSSLKARVDLDAPLSLDDALGLTRQILAGLAAIHDAGIIHRDIKPQNVLLDADGRVKLTDFGLARRATDSGLTETGITVGSAAYMAPEQALGGHLTPAADLYAVGIILFELLSGRLPFISDHPLGVMYQQVHQQPPSLRALNQAVPGVLDGIVARALAKDPRQRYPSARAMQGAIDAVAAARKTRMLPAGRRESPRLTAARGATTRFLVTAGVAIVLLLAGMVVVTMRSDDHGTDLAAGPALASSQFIGPRLARGVLSRPTPTAAASATTLAPPPIQPAAPVAPPPTSTSSPAPRPKATEAPTPVRRPTPIVELNTARAPPPTPIVVPTPTQAPPASSVSSPPRAPATLPAPKRGTLARGRSDPAAALPSRNGKGHRGPPPLEPPALPIAKPPAAPPKPPGATGTHGSSPPGIQPKGHGAHGPGGGHKGKASHTPRGG